MEDDSGKNGEKRDKSGKYLPGHCGGPGRTQDPRKHLRQALLESTTADQIVRVFNKVYEQAITDRFDKDGCSIGADMGAARLFLEYTIGKPRQQIEIEGGGMITGIQLAFIGLGGQSSTPPALNGNGNGQHRLPSE